MSDWKTQTTPTRKPRRVNQNTALGSKQKSVSFGQRSPFSVLQDENQNVMQQQQQQQSLQYNRSIEVIDLTQDSPPSNLNQAGWQIGRTPVKGTSGHAVSKDITDNCSLICIARDCRLPFTVDVDILQKVHQEFEGRYPQKYDVHVLAVIEAIEKSLRGVSVKAIGSKDFTLLQKTTTSQSEYVILSDLIIKPQDYFTQDCLDYCIRMMLEVPRNQVQQVLDKVVSTLVQIQNNYGGKLVNEKGLVYIVFINLILFSPVCNDLDVNLENTYLGIVSEYPYYYANPTVSHFMIWFLVQNQFKPGDIAHFLTFGLPSFSTAIIGSCASFQRLCDEYANAWMEQVQLMMSSVQSNSTSVRYHINVDQIIQLMLAAFTRDSVLASNSKGLKYQDTLKKLAYFISDNINYFELDRRRLLVELLKAQESKDADMQQFSLKAVTWLIVKDSSLLKELAYVVQQHGQRVLSILQSLKQSSEYWKSIQVQKDLHQFLSHIQQLQSETLYDGQNLSYENQILSLFQGDQLKDSQPQGWKMVLTLIIVIITGITFAVCGTLYNEQILHFVYQLSHQVMRIEMQYQVSEKLIYAGTFVFYVLVALCEWAYEWLVGVVQILTDAAYHENLWDQVLNMESYAHDALRTFSRYLNESPQSQ
ncbi:hypothetical protein MIR68_003438 [Amoeboaphelidium protococcarum]|nr:hypothetical protein MIR68_003438 [Amoeboaphelidium protococcarum]